MLSKIAKKLQSKGASKNFSGLSHDVMT